MLANGYFLKASRRQKAEKRLHPEAVTVAIVRENRALRTILRAELGRKTNTNSAGKCDPEIIDTGRWELAPASNLL